MRILKVILVLLALLGTGPAARAQVLAPPARPERSRPPRETRAQNAARGVSPFRLGINLLGGVDDSIAALGGSVAGPASSSATGYQGFSDVTFGYTLSNPDRELDASARGFVATNRNLDLGPSYGSQADVQGRTALGRRSEFAVAAGLRYDQYLSLGTWGEAGTGPIPNLPSTNPTNSLLQRRAMSTQTAATINRRWTRETTTTFAYAYSRQSYLDNNGFEGGTHTGSVNLSRAFGLNTGVRAGFQRSASRYEDANGTALPTSVSMIDGGVSYARDLSPTRRFSLSAGGGTSYVDTVNVLTRAPYVYWTPTGYAQMTVGILRSWVAAASYRRVPTMLHGVTAESFLSESATISVGGLYSRRAQGVFTVGYTDGVASPDPGQVANSRYNAYTGTAQLVFELTPWWSAVANYTRYQHRANAAASAGLGLTPNFDRNALRVGFSWSFPQPGGRTRE